MKALLALILLPSWAGAAAGYPLVLKGHSDEVSDAVFLRDGERLFSVGADRTLRLWNTRTGEELKRWDAESEDLSVARVLEDGRTALTGGLGHSLKLWDLETGKELATLKGHKDTVSKVALSPDGKTAATVTYVGVLALWDVAARKETASLQTGPLANALDAAFSPDGKILLEARWDKTIRVWDVEKRRVAAVWEGHRNKVLCLAFSPDGRKAASGSRDNTVRLWDAATGKTERILKGHKSWVKAVAFSPDGRRLLSAGRDHAVRLWDADSGESLAVWEGHLDHVNSAAFSPDGRLAATASHDHTIRIWDVSASSLPAAETPNAVKDYLPPGPEGEEARLGRLLFFDQRLAGDGSRSCAFCHIPQKAYSDGRGLALSYLDTLYFRNTPGLVNSAKLKHLYWDGRLPGEDLPSMLRDHISESDFMNADGRLIIEKLRQAPGYVEAFRRVYGGEPSYPRLLDALAAYLRTLSSGQSPYDRYLAGDKNALGARAREGLALFNGSAGCAGCHGGPLLTDDKLHARKVPENPENFKDPLRRISFRRFFKVFGVEGYHSLTSDPGLYAITKNPADRGRFRTPALREVARTAPYMHDGVFAALDDAVAHENPKLSPAQREKIVAFLESLSSPFPVAEPPPLPEYALIPNTAAGPEHSEVPARPTDPSRVPGKRRQGSGGLAIDQPSTPAKFPPLGPLPPAPVPPDNPITPEKVELGKKLFFDQRVSGNAETYCVTCHEPAMGWGDGAGLAQGYEGTLHWRNSQTLINAAYFMRLNWDGSKTSLEDQARAAITSNISGNGDPAMIEERLAEVPEYVRRFKRVFGVERPHFEGVLKAIAAFERAELVSRGAPFDAFARGDAAALTPEQKEGLKLFNGKAACIRCHNGPLASDQDFHATGVPKNPAFDASPLRQIALRYQHALRGVPEEVYRTAYEDPGLYMTTHEEADRGKFRTASLRELRHTAPYMHNGVFETLEEVVDFYNAGGGEAANKSPLLKPLELTAGEKKSLLAFLKSLSGEEIKIETPIEAGEHYTTTGFAPGDEGP